MSKKATGKQRKRAVSPQNGSDITEHQWKPGQSGNPKGAKPGPQLRTVLRRLFDAVPGSEDIMHGSIIMEAKKGNVQAYRVLVDKLYPDEAAEQNVNVKVDLEKIRKRIGLG